MTGADKTAPTSGSRERTSEAERASIIGRLQMIDDKGWRIAGVSLYMVVGPDVVLEPTPSGGEVPYWGSAASLGGRILFRVTEFSLTDADAKVAPDGKRDPRSMHAPEHPLHGLPQLLADMLAWVYKTQPGLAGGGNQYVTVHIQGLHAPRSRPPHLRSPQHWFTPQARRARVGRSGATPEWEEDGLPLVVRLYLSEALAMFDPAPVGSPPSYYDHYDSHTHQTGHLAFGRNAAVLGGLSDESLRKFVSLLQIGEMASTGGLTHATFTPTLSLMAQWNGNEDVREIRDQVIEFKHGVDAATSGQIWISWALAVIGVGLGLINFVKVQAYLLPGFLLLGVASFFFAAYARTTNRNWLRIGIAIFVTGVLAGVIGLLLNVF